MTDQPIKPANRAKGIVAGILGAMAFGFIPVFSKPVLNEGLSFSCLLLYRFGLAAVMLAVMMKAKGMSLRLPLGYLPTMLYLTVFYSISGGFLVLGYKYMSGGVTGVIHFTYPVFVMALLLVFFKERIRMSSVVAIVIALAGVYCLGVLGGDAAFVPGADRLAGVLIVIGSGIACASYMVGVNKSRVRRLPSSLLTLWLLAIGAVFFAIISAVDGTIEFVTSPFMLANFFGLSLIATVLSNLMLVYSIKNIGSTLTSILSAMEPATAIVCCIILFGESLNLPIVIGIILIFASVAIVISRYKK